MSDAVNNLDLFVADQGNSLRQQVPLSFLHHPLLQGFRRVVLVHGDSLLQNDRPAVAYVVDKMHRGARNLDPALQGSLMYM